MGKTGKAQVESGRVTPRAPSPVTAPRSAPHGTHGPDASSRYTPPVPIEDKVSPSWVPILMFGLLVIGVILIFLNYIGVVPGGRSNWYLLGGSRPDPRWHHHRHPVH